LAVVSTHDARQAGGGADAVLRPVLAQARRLAAAFGRPVGLRELFLALASIHPDLVVRHLRREGIDVRRLLWAMREWGPAGHVTPASAAEVPMTPEARGWLLEAARTGGPSACSALVARLTDPAALSGAPADREAGGAPAVTDVVLSRLGLI